MKKLSALQLNKKSIAKLNDAQLIVLKGGNQISAPGNTVIVNCQVKTATVINTKVS
jgi:natural product precursor